MLPRGIQVKVQSVLTNISSSPIVIQLSDEGYYVDTGAVQDATVIVDTDGKIHIKGVVRKVFQCVSSHGDRIYKDVTDKLLAELDYNPKDLVVEPKKWYRAEYQYLINNCFYKSGDGKISLEITEPYVIVDHRKNP